MTERSISKLLWVDRKWLLTLLGGLFLTDVVLVCFKLKASTCLPTLPIGVPCRLLVRSGQKVISIVERIDKCMETSDWHQSSCDIAAEKSGTSKEEMFR